MLMRDSGSELQQRGVSENRSVQELVTKEHLPAGRFPAPGMAPPAPLKTIN